MAATNPQELQVVTPQPEPQIVPVVQEESPVAPQAPVHVDAPENRILTPEETGALLRGEQIGQEPVPLLSDADDPEQAQMAGDFFDTVPRESSAVQPDQQPAAPVQQQVQPQAQPPVQQLPHIQQQVAQQVQQAQPQPLPVQGGIAPAPPPVSSPEVAALQAQNQLLQQQIQQVQQQQAPAQVQPGPQPAGNFNFQVPQNYMAALGSEDPNQAGAALNGILNGVANTMAQQFRAEMDDRFNQVPTAIQSQITTADTSRRVFEDMYGTYPELAPHRGFVKTAAESMGLTDTAMWSADVRDAIAEKVAPMVPGLNQKINQIRANRMGVQAGLPAASLPQGNGAAQPPQMANGGVPQYSPAPFQGGTHGAPAPAPMLVRDHTGRVVQHQVPAQQYVPQNQARPAAPGYSPEQLDIWSTLGF